MTNSPTYDQQIALNEYWKLIGGTVMLPGTNRAADRFARASFYINATRQSADQREATVDLICSRRHDGCRVHQTFDSPSVLRRL
jgi:penicillin V acylase-like amidase (Ntn superfamily)